MYTLILSLILAHSSPKAVNAKELAAEIIYQSAIYGVDPIHATQVIMVESRGIETAYNVKSRDFGLAQINIVNAKAYNISSKCLFTWKCNLKYGMIILAKKKHARKCAFNLGLRGAKDPKKAHLCEIYERKLASIK